jgi:uncharacterized protein
MAPTPSFFRWAGADLELQIHAQPGAHQSEVAGVHGDALKLRLAARPVEGAANEALVAFLADALQVPRRAVVLVAGAASRRKRVRITGPERGLSDRLLREWAGGADG